ncbi:pilus assembly protein PilM [Candidatus Methylomirabilis sp.]|uniref:pilus assembly protein PilM n=1 Tax=Candidatus Methylomirabilis sp. TaxID=2032687 RepID=UPI0030767854
MTLGELIPRPKVSLGIDIRGGLLCHALLSKAFGQVQLLDWGIEELPAGEKDRPEVLKEKLAGLVTRLPKRPVFVAVGLPRRLVTMRLISMPAVDEEEMKGILDYEVERHVPFPPEEAQYDFQVLERDAEKATVLLAAARKEEVGRYLTLLQEAGITPTAVGVSTVASLNALLYNQDRGAEPLRALIDLRNGEAELGLAKQGIFRYSRYLTLGQAAPIDVLAPEISTLFAHREADGGRQAGRISIAGTGVGRGDLLRHLAERTGLEVEFLQPFRRIKAKGVDPQVAHSLGMAVGLALNGLVTLPLDIDLLPKELVPPRRDPSLAMTFRLVALIVALGLAYLVNGAIRERRALAELTVMLNRVQAEAAKVESLKGEVASLVGQITTLETIDREEVRKLDVLRELFQVLPKGVTLTLFTVEKREAKIGGIITGSASDLISILEQSPLFENAQFTSPVAQRGAEGQEFQIKALLEARKEKRP